MVTLAVAGAALPAFAAPNDSPAGSVDTKTREKSRAAFRRGVIQLRAQDWAGARASFEEAWSLVQHPSILLNLGIARLHTDDPILAEQDLVRFLSEDPGAAPEELASAREALAEARSHIGTLRVRATPAAARVLVDGKPVAVRALAGGDASGVAEARLKAGAHTVVVDAAGYEPTTKSVDLPAKTDTEVEVTLVAEVASKPPPRASPSSTRRIVGWSLAGTAGVAFVASGLMGFRAISLAGDYDDRGSPSFQKANVKGEGITFRTGADVALLAGLLAGTGAVILLFTEIGTSHATPASVASALARPVVRW